MRIFLVFICFVFVAPSVHAYEGAEKEIMDFYSDFSETIVRGDFDHIVELAHKYLAEDFKGYHDSQFSYDKTLFIKNMKENKAEGVQGINRNFIVNDIFINSDRSEIMVDITVQSWSDDDGTDRVYEDDFNCVEKFRVFEEPKSVELYSCVCMQVNPIGAIEEDSAK